MLRTAYKAYLKLFGKPAEDKLKAVEAEKPQPEAELLLRVFLLRKNMQAAPASDIKRIETAWAEANRSVEAALGRVGGSDVIDMVEEISKLSEAAEMEFNRLTSFSSDSSEFARSATKIREYANEACQYAAAIAAAAKIYKQQNFELASHSPSSPRKRGPV